MAEEGTVAQLQLNVEAGTYCIEVYDIGTIVQPAAFSVTLVHP